MYVGTPAASADPSMLWEHGLSIGAPIPWWAAPIPEVWGAQVAPACPSAPGWESGNSHPWLQPEEAPMGRCHSRCHQSPSRPTADLAAPEPQPAPSGSWLSLFQDTKAGRLCAPGHLLPLLPACMSITAPAPSPGQPRALQPRECSLGSQGRLMAATGGHRDSPAALGQGDVVEVQVGGQAVGCSCLSMHTAP